VEPFTQDLPGGACILVMLCIKNEGLLGKEAALRAATQLNGHGMVFDTSLHD
jgi:hypothetical protein